MNKWFVGLKNKSGIPITNAFQEILDESGRQLKALWIDKNGDFYNRSMKLWLKENDIEMFQQIMEENHSDVLNVLIVIRQYLP